MILNNIGITMVRLYQRLVSPLMVSRCRFYPSCSEYTVQAIERFGLFRGVWIGIMRLGRCHPFSKGGVDKLQEKRL